METTIRFALAGDLPRIVEIYNQAIAAGNANADTRPITTGDRHDWFREHDPESFPIYIIENEKQILGWGSLSPYRKGREGLRKVAEISYFLDYNFHGCGIGSQLIRHIIADCQRLGIRHLFAVMLDLNTASAAILEKFGFHKWGHLPAIVDLNGKICGQWMYGRHIGR
jgi:phosphinothricin acetyltransferase